MEKTTTNFKSKKGLISPFYFLGILMLFLLNLKTAIAQPLNAIANSTNVLCNGQCNGSATASASYGSPPYTYSWSPGGQTTATIGGLCPGTYTVTVTDQVLAVTTATVSVNEPSLINAMFSHTKITCNGGNNGSINATPMGGVGPFTYDWSPGSPSGDGTPGIYNLPSATYTLTITDANNCVRSLPFNLPQPPMLNPNAGPDKNICIGDSVILTGGAMGGILPHYFAWSPSTGLSCTSCPSPKASPSNNTDYELMVTDSAGCVKKDTVKVSAYNSPTANAGSDIVVCMGVPVNFMASVTGAGVFNWNFGDGSPNSNVLSPSHNYMNPGTYTVIFTAVGPACNANDTITVTVNPLPASDAGPDKPICSGASTVIGSSPNAGLTYSWSPTTGLTDPSSSNPGITLMNGSTNAITVPYNLTTTNTLTGCSSMDQVDVFVRPLPGTNLISDTASCLNTINFFGNAPGAVSYNWNFGDAITSTVQNPSHTFGGAATYQVILNATTSLGCSKADTTMVTIHPAPPVLSMTSLPIKCNGANDGKMYVTVISGSAPYTYDWFPGTPTGEGTDTIVNLGPGTYNVKVTDTNSCFTISSNVSIMDASPILLIPSHTDVKCFGDSTGVASVGVVGGTGPYDFSWAPSGATTSGITVKAGTYTVTVTDANQCQKVAPPIIVNEPPDLTVNTIPDLTKCLGDTAIIDGMATGGRGTYTYSWSDGSSQKQHAVIPSVTTTYTLTVVDSNNCMASDPITVTIALNKSIYVTVEDSLGALSTGVNKVILLKQNPLKSAHDTLAMGTLTASGNYNFSSIIRGNYWLKVIPDTSLHKNLFPTYFGNKILWDSAAILNHKCIGNSMADIMMQKKSTKTGPGLLRGRIVEDAGFSRAPGEPIPGIDIKLGKNPGGSMMQSTSTDTEGYYTFENLPLNGTGESYTIYVDIPGMGRDSSYTVVLDTANSTINNLDYKVDSNSVNVAPSITSISNPEMAKQTKFIVYPNPFKETTTIAYALETAAVVKVEVYNLLGTKINTVINAKQIAGDYTHKIEQPNSGVYFITLTIDGQVSTQRVIVTE